MIETLPTISLTLSQIVQLIGYCAAYRSYLWHALAPVPERNQLIRRVQRMQGRLEYAREQKQEVSFAGAEQTLLRELLGGLTRAYGQAPPSEQRTRQLGELTAFRRQIEVLSRRTRMPGEPIDNPDQRREERSRKQR